MLRGVFLNKGGVPGTRAYGQPREHECGRGTISYRFAKQNILSPRKNAALFPTYLIPTPYLIINQIQISRT